MGVNITASELVTGAFDFMRDCVINGRYPSDQLEYSNGETTADFDYIIYKKDIVFYWDCKIKINSTMSDSFIAGYNHKARELNMPLYNEIANMLKLVSISVLYNLYSRQHEDVLEVSLNPKS